MPTSGKQSSEVPVTETFKKSRSGVTRQVTAGSIAAASDLRFKPSGEFPLAHQWWRELLKGRRPSVPQMGAISTVDLFCGSGGLSLGARLAIEACGLEHRPLMAVDVDVEALTVYKSNFGVRTILPINAGSIVDYHLYGQGEDATLAYQPELIDGRVEALRGRVDLLLAGPPCQGHSNLNNHTRRSDPRNSLYLSVAATAIALRVKAVIIENVPEVVSDKSNVVQAAQKLLVDCGYTVSSGVLNATELGGAQTRKRHFLVATKNNQPHEALEHVATALSRPAMTLREVIGDLEMLEGGSYLDEGPTLSAENLSRIDYLFDTDTYDLPDEQRPDCHKNGHTYPSVYGRMYWDRPSQTITTGFMTPGRGRYIHPSQRRVITPREAARIQGFPDGFDFSLDGKAPSKKALAKWIGDAVPSWLGYVATLTALSSY